MTLSKRRFLSAAAGLSVAAVLPLSAKAAQAKRPNFLVIVADDLGYSDLGAFGGDIATPNLDKLALSGLRLTGFHSAPTCSPTRAQLLTGTDHHLVGLGAMSEMIAPNQSGKPGYEGYLRADTATLPELLKAGGYATLLSGKWHLGVAPEQDPSKRGFDKSFTLLEGAHNHFGRIANSALFTTTYRENGKDVTELPKDFYSSDYFATRLIDFLKETKAQTPAKPFFAYLAFTAPHWPLHAPEETIAKYKGRYDAGFEVLREQRLKKLKALGLVPQEAPAHPLAQHDNYPRWADLKPEEKAQYIKAQEVYASMVDRLDWNIGRVTEALKASGDLDNTVILFLADNGAEGFDLLHNQLPPVVALRSVAKNETDNIGKVDSFFAYGPGWAQAGTAPSYLYKGYASEGGTRTVSFITWPGFKRQGTISKTFGTVQDITPTFLELAGIKAPQGTFEGRKVEPIRGKSWAAYLKGQTDRVHGENDAFGQELFGSRAIRKGDWKILAERAGDDWKLFNIADDPGETTDLSVKFPEKRKELIAAWDDYARTTNIIVPTVAYYNP
ncbi:MAG: arylsulfatase [Asticcacaulis sp.]